MAQVKKGKKDIQGNILRIDFVNGQVLSMDAESLSPEIKQQLLMHGLSQKEGDSYATAETVEDAFKAATKVWEELSQGKWTVRKAGDGAPRTTLLAEALARIAGRTMEEAEEVIEELSDEDIKKLRADPGVKKVIAEIKLERANKAAEGSQSVVAALFQ